MPKRLDHIDRELIRRAPDGLDVVYRLQELFGVSARTIYRIDYNADC